MDPQLFEYLQGYLTDRRKGLFKKVLQERTRHITVVTEDVYQLHNTSAVMRSCDVFGIQDLHVIEDRLGKKVDREIAMGAQKWVDIYRHRQAGECITKLQDQGYRIVATVPHGEATSLEDFNVTQPVALFFGAEKEGVSQVVLDKATEYLQIPMVGFSESLNISVSAAIILQTLTARLRSSNIAWQLSEAEKYQIEVAWTKKSIKDVDSISQRFFTDKKS